MYSPYLSEELLMEILSWVSVKVLMRLRCVSKCWNSLISNPTFIKLHLERSSRNTDILLTFTAFDGRERGDGGIADVCLAPCSIHGLLESPLSTIHDTFWHRFSQYMDLWIVDVCNGLVCLCNSRYDYSYQFLVWNPATRIMSLASPWLPCPPKKFHHMFGFGYDDLSDTYKVLVLLLDIQSQIWEVKSHCFGDTCWRSISNFSTSPSIFPLESEINGGFVSGRLNWLTLRGFSGPGWPQIIPINGLVIFSYDIRNKTYTYLLPPHDLCDDILSSSDVELGVLRGSLCLSHNHKDINFVVWRMTEFGVEKSWTRILNVCYEPRTFVPETRKPVYISESGDVTILDNCSSEFIIYSSEFIIYNTRYNKILNRLVSEELFGHSYYSYDYCQSLVLPYGN